MSTPAAPEAHQVRDVTTDELDHFFDKVWVVLRDLISRDWATELLDASKGLLGEQGDAPRPIGFTPDRKLTFFREVFGAGLKDATIGSFILGDQLGRQMARFLYGGGDGAVRSGGDFIFVKRPEAKDDSADAQWGAGITDFHQDVTNEMPVIGHVITFQVSLARNTPEMGTMRFYEGSHHLGPVFHPDRPLANPRLAACPVSSPLTLEPGDATVHSYFTLHGAGENKTDQPRWNLGSMFFGADAPYSGKSACSYPNIDEMRSQLTLREPLDTPLTPVVYRPAGVPA